jgi:hypothetical protein
MRGHQAQLFDLLFYFENMGWSSRTEEHLSISAIVACAEQIEELEIYFYSCTTSQMQNEMKYI